MAVRCCCSDLCPGLTPLGSQATRVRGGTYSCAVWVSRHEPKPAVPSWLCPRYGDPACSGGGCREAMMRTAATSWASMPPRDPHPRSSHCCSRYNEMSVSKSCGPHSVCPRGPSGRDREPLAFSGWSRRGGPGRSLFSFLSLGSAVGLSSHIPYPLCLQLKFITKEA